MLVLPSTDTFPPCQSKRNKNTISPAFHTQQGSCYVVTTEQSPRFFELKSLHRFHPSRWLAFRWSSVSSALTASLGRIPMNKKNQSLLPTKKDFPVPIISLQVLHNNNSLQEEKEWQYMNENGSTSVIGGLLKEHFLAYCNSKVPTAPDVTCLN